MGCGVYSPAPDPRPYRISNVSSTLGLGKPGINGSTGKAEIELAESHSALLAVNGFERDTHFLLDVRV